MMQYSSPDGAQIDAYLSQPGAPGNYPGVIVTMEGMGLEDHMKDLCRRFAEQGYIAIAPDLYTREGRPEPDKVLENLFSIPDSQTMGDLEGAALFLKSHANANGRVGIIGFCSGGRYTLMFACSSQNVNAAVDSAGGHIIPDDGRTDARPVAAIDMVADLSCPLLALFGEEDANPSPAHAARLREELDKHTKTYEYQTYANAGHAFFADYRPSYRAGPAQDMWHRVLLFYEKHLQA
jgi:carboxymethylenebutenolidase